MGKSVAFGSQLNKDLAKIYQLKNCYLDSRRKLPPPAYRSSLNFTLWSAVNRAGSSMGGIQRGDRWS